MSTDLRDLPLTPRTVAVLVALRGGPRTLAEIADAIADGDAKDTAALLVLMASGINGDHTGRKLAQPTAALSATRRIRYGLTHDGLGWLQSHGIDATPAAKQALYDATDAQAVRS